MEVSAGNAAQVNIVGGSLEICGQVLTNVFPS